MSSFYLDDNLDDVLADSVHSLSQKTPNIYDLQNFNNDSINLHFIFKDNSIYKIYLDGIELNYRFKKWGDPCVKSISMFNILKYYNIFLNKKYIFLKNDESDLYFTTNLDDSSSIDIDINSKIINVRLYDKCMLNQITLQKIILYIKLPLDKTEKYINFNIKKNIRGICGSRKNLEMITSEDFSLKHCNKFTLFNELYVPIFFKIDICLPRDIQGYAIPNKRSDINNLLSYLPDCIKIKNIIIPLHIDRNTAELHCELYKDHTDGWYKKSYRLYLKKIIFPNYEIINYEESCKKCIKQNSDLNIFNKYDSLCYHMVNKIYLKTHKYVKNINFIKISDFVEQIDELKYEKFYIIFNSKEYHVK
jgi:hypothetical protein